MARRIWTLVKPFPAIAALLALTTAPASGADNPYSCVVTKNVFSSRMQDVAYTQIARTPSRSRIVYNASFAQRALGCDGSCMQYVVGGHECTHASGVLNETRADCGGVKLMKKAGKWSPGMKAAVAKSLQRTRGDYEHPPGPQRVRDIDKCDKTTAGLGPDPAAPAAPPPAQETRPEPPKANACYYAILGCYRSQAEANAEKDYLGGSLAVTHTDDVSGFRGGYYCVTSQPSTQEAAYSTVSSFRRRVPSSYVKKGC